MRIQRAPLASAQPQPPPLASAQPPPPPLASAQPPPPPPPPPPGRPGTPFSATVDLDVTRLVAHLDRSRLVAEVAVALVEAGRAEGLIDDTAPLHVARFDIERTPRITTGRGLVGRRLDGGAQPPAIAAALDCLTAEWSTPSPRALTIVDAGGGRARIDGDWGLPGAAVATLGRAEPTVVSRRLLDGPAVAQRQLAPFTLVVPDARTQAAAALRALEMVVCRVESTLL